MSKWYMLTLIGRDQIGIVARVTAALFDLGCQLGETSMLRLGGNFTMMLMTEYDGEGEALHKQLAPVVAEFDLHLHIDKIDGKLHDHVVPEIQISVHGADRPGIIAKITAQLAQLSFNILGLESDVAGTAQRPVYVMHIEGVTPASEADIVAALGGLADEGIQIKVSAIDTVVG